MLKIVSITADSKGRATVYQRENRKISKTTQFFDNWMVLQDFSNIKANCGITELDDDLPFKYLIKSQNINTIAKNFDYKNIIKYNNVQQYLIASKNSYFEGMEFSDLYRLQFDIETTVNNPRYIPTAETDEIYLIAVSDTEGYEEVITGDEAEIIQRLIDIIQSKDPDVIENHNIFGFDFPFICGRAKKHGIELTLGRDGSDVWDYEDTVKIGGQSEKFQRYMINGREVIDTMFLIRRRIYHLRSRGYGLKNTAMYLGIATDDRIYIDGDKIYDTWKKDPEKVEKYAIDDVREVRAISNELLRVDFELTKIFPDKLDRVATAGTATMIDMLLVREYIHAGHSIPAPTHKKEKYTGGFAEIYQKGIMKDVVKADVSSLYPSIMLTHKIKPDNDPLNIFQTNLQQMTNQRLEAKSRMTKISKDTTEYKAIDAYQTGLKLIINSFYGLLGANFTHFNSPNTGAPKVTAIGREILQQMISIIKKLGGIPIEADTDGVYVSGIAEEGAASFVERINTELAQEDIIIDFDGYWKAIYSYSKKSYVLLNTDGCLVKKGVFNKGDEEAFIGKAKDEIVQFLFEGQIRQINEYYKQILERIRKGELDISDIVKRQRLSKDLDKYGNVSIPHIKILNQIGIKAKQGYLVEYYRGIDDWKLATEFDGNYDVSHYINRINKVVNTIFLPAFTNTDRDVIFSEKQFEFDFSTIEPQTEEVEDDPVVVDESEATAWIELSYGNKLEDKPNRWNWMRIDKDSIIDFVKEYDYLDVHRSNLAYWSDEAPTGANLNRYKQLGDYFLEIEGKETDSEDLFSNTVKGDQSVNDIVVECARKVIDKLIDLGVNKKDIVVYYNGGKSLYVHFPMNYVCPEPRYRLNEVYRAITEKLIIESLPDEFQKLIDTQIYNAKHTLRMPNTKHHKSERFGYTIDLNDLYSKNWEELTQRNISHTEVRVTFTEAPQIPQDDTKIIPEFARIAYKIENAPQQAKGKRRESKAKQYRDNVRQIEYIINNISREYVPPCIPNIGKAIGKKESIGFGGRNKFISEMLIYMRAEGLNDRDIENEICKVFLSNGDPNRYGVLEKDKRDDSNPCGYRLKQKYFNLEKIETFDPSCQIAKEFCDPANCYRHQQLKPSISPTPYNEFSLKVRDRTAQAVNQTGFSNPKIVAIDASINSGKTYQICLRAVQLANSGQIAIIFTHSHSASQECCDNIAKMGLQTGVCINMRGKSELTCLKEHRNCRICKLREQFFSKDKEERELAQQGLVSLCKGQVVDLRKAQQLAEKYDACPFVIMRALATAMHTGIIIANHNYLGDTNLHQILNKIPAGYYFVDEADQLIANIISRYQQKMVVAKTRSNLQHTYRESCGNQCDKCKLHFADIFDRGMDTRQNIKGSELEQINKPQNFIDTLRNAIKTTSELSGDVIYEIFNLEALNTNINRLEKVLSLIDTDAKPYDAIRGLEESLINSNLGFVTVDQIYEGLTTHDGTVIFPDENIVSIEVENPVNQDVLLGLFNPDPDDFDDLQSTNQQLTYGKLFPDEEKRSELHGTEIEIAIKTCLAFANLSIKGDGKIGLYFEKRRVYDDTTIPNNKQNLMSCGLSLRVFDRDGFMAVINNMARHNTLLLSGTFINHEMLATSLLLSPADIDYIDVTEPMHDRFLIIHTDRKGAKTAEGIKVSSIGNKHLTEIYRRVTELLEYVHILNFEKNINQGNIYFYNLNTDSERNSKFYIENLCNRTPQIADWCVYEAKQNKERNITIDKLMTIDKLRSSRARAVNRAMFNICTVHGNGYVDWYDFLPYVQKIRDTVNPDIQLDDMFEYDRRKVVAQAITRAPRDENRTVGLYFGDMPYIDYPEYLKPCVVLLDELLPELKERYPQDFICNIETQIELTARVIAGFIKGDVTHTDFSTAFKDFEFKGEYEGGAHEERKVDVNLLGLSDIERYAVESFVEKYKDNTDHSQAVNAIAEKLKYIKNCIAEKGYLDKTDDRKGKYSEWKDLITHLVEIGYLRKEKIDTDGRRKKTIYIYNQSQNQ